MDIDQLNAQWTEEEVRQRIATSLSQALADAGLEHTEIKVTDSEMVVTGIDDTPETQKIIADATKSALIANGVTDTTGIATNILDEAGNKHAYNVVYKDGGWIFNSKNGFQDNITDANFGGVLGSGSGGVSGGGGM